MTLTEDRTLPLRILDCGLQPYLPILDLQHELTDQLRAGRAVNTVLLLEHKPVITLGARKTANRLTRAPDLLRSDGIDTVDIRRGGGATAHNPGQLVFYPILNLAKLKLSITEYIRQLEQIGIELLDNLGIQAERKKGFPGLWVGPEKIASVGVRVSRQISYHGMAINICNDLRIFANIVPCGLDGVKITSAKQLTNTDYSMDEVKEKLKTILTDHFSSPRKTEYEKYTQAAELA